MIRAPLHPNRPPLTEGFNALEMPRALLGWVTTNGFDVTYYLSDGSTMEVMEEPNDQGWRFRHFIGAITLINMPVPTRSAGVKMARDLATAMRVRAVPSAEQRAAPWFKGEDFDYTADDRGRRQFANGLTVITPEDRAARLASQQQSKSADAIALAQAEFLNNLMKGGKT